MLLGDFMDLEIEMKEEYHLPPVKRARWQRIAYLLWKNGGTFVLPDIAIALGQHKNLKPLEVKELFEYKAIVFGASFYTSIWDEVYIPKITEYMAGLDVKKKLLEDQVKYN